MTVYKFLSQQKDRSIRAGAGVEYARIAILPANTYAAGSNLRVVENDGAYSKAGDVWLKIDKPREGWVAVVHRGVEQGEMFSDEIIPPAPVSPAPKYFRVKHDSEFPPYISRLEALGVKAKVVGIPSTVKMTAQKPYVRFSEEWQQYAFELLKRRVAEKFPSAPMDSVEYTARSLFKTAYTSDRFQSNKNGSDRNADYINKTNLNAEPIRLEPIVTGGAIVKCTGEYKRIAGVLCAQIECFNVNDAPPRVDDINYDTAQSLIFFATIETRIPEQPRGRVIRLFEFNVPKKNGKLPKGITSDSIVGIPFFVLTDTGTAWIDARRLESVNY